MLRDYTAGSQKHVFAKRDAEDKQMREDSSPSRDREDVSGMYEWSIGVSVDTKVVVGTGGDGTSTKATGMDVQR